MIAYQEATAENAALGREPATLVVRESESPSGSRLPRRMPGSAWFSDTTGTVYKPSVNLYEDDVSTRVSTT